MKKSRGDQLGDDGELSDSKAEALFRPQVKVCGLTVVDEAIACAEIGADAIGLVFYPPSSRFVSMQKAREISVNLPNNVRRVGVFVDEPLPELLKTVEFCRLDAVQLHGSETPEMVKSLESDGIFVIKALFSGKAPFLSDVFQYPASAYLVESGEAAMPGGVGLSWNWREAAGLFNEVPCILAGGLNPGNVSEAICEFKPDGVDVSSGVESSPGRKDLDKVRKFINAVRNVEFKSPRLNQRIFK